jgi:hypothetical protein
MNLKRSNKNLMFFSYLDSTGTLNRKTQETITGMQLLQFKNVRTD